MFSENFGKKEGINPQSNTKEVNTASSSRGEKGPSDGERMTAELKGIISQFLKKVSLKMCHDTTKLPWKEQTFKTIYEPSYIQVEELKVSVSNMLVSTAEQQMVSMLTFFI